MQQSGQERRRNTGALVENQVLAVQDSSSPDWLKQNLVSIVSCALTLAIVLITMYGSYVRSSTLQESLEKRFDRYEEHVDKRLDKVEEKIDKISAKSQ